MRIIDLTQKPELIPTIVGWIQKEWPNAGNGDAAKVETRLCGDRDPAKLPVALVALEGVVPVGMVSLTMWEAGIEKQQPHWIDGVIVDPAHRRKGIGLVLVGEAERRAKKLGIKELHALTPYPGLYTNVGWMPFASMLEDRNMVLKKSL